MTDIPFGEITDDTETVESGGRIYLEITFDSHYTPRAWDGGKLTLLHVEETRFGWNHELHGRDEDGEFYKVEIDEDEAETVLNNETGGVWNYAELPE